MSSADNSLGVFLRLSPACGLLIICSYNCKTRPRICGHLSVSISLGAEVLNFLEVIVVM